MQRSRIRGGLALVAVLLPGLALAGPPYVTDDPEPTDYSHWEIYGFAGGAHVRGVTSGEGGLDLNYGAAKDLQLTVVLPLAYESGQGTRVGWGAVELAAKYKILHQMDGSLIPDVAVFPRLFLATQSRRFRSGPANLLLPVWVGKDFGAWSVFGGGGYQINPGAGKRNFWTSGLAVSRTVSKRLSLGAEVYHHTADATDGLAFTGVNVGAAYRVSDHWSVLAAGGPGIQNARDEGRYGFYVALKADY